MSALPVVVSESQFRGSVAERLGAGLIATNATSGFLYAPTCAGTPTGTPANTPDGCAPVVIDSTNHRLYFFSGGAWRNAGP